MMTSLLAMMEARYASGADRLTVHHINPSDLDGVSGWLILKDLTRMR
jgi:hypothetical protein